MSLAERIKAVRSKLNLTQKEFAEEFNIPKRTIENWEGGSRTPPVYVVELLERVSQGR